MKFSHVVPLYAASGLAHDHHSHSHSHHHDHVHQHTEVCGSRWPSLQSFGSGGPMCLPGLPATGFLDTGSKAPYEQHPLANKSAARSSTGRNSSPITSWTQTTPCFTSTKTGEELCVYADANFADGRGTAFVTTAKRAAFLASQRAFTQPESVRGVNQDLDTTIPPKYEMKAIPGKGMGLIATDFIHRGDLIMANTASLMFDYKIFDDLTQEQYRLLKASAVDALPTRHREAVLKLSTQNEQASNLSYVALVDTVVSTNAFDIEPDPADDEQDSSFYVVFPEIARTNHDCRPNSDYYFDHDTLVQYVHALRDIYPGEELTLSYINPVQKRLLRMAHLQRNWGFRCSCPLCTAEQAAADASDARIRAINDLHPDLKSYKPDSRASPQMAELMISLYEQEKLWGFLYEAYTLAALEYNGAGEPWTASKYAYLAIEHGIPVVGEGDNDIVEMRKLAADPFGHWSWMLRTRKKMAGGKKKKEEEEDDD